MIAAFVMGVGVAANGEVKVGGPCQKLKSRAQDADDLIRHAIQNDRLANNIRITAEFLLPTIRRRDDRRCSAWRIVRVCKKSTQSRSRASQRKKTAGHQRFVREYRVASASQRQVLARESRHILKGIIVMTPVLEIDPGDTDASGLGRGFAEPHEALAVRVRQRPQEHGIDHAENGGVRAYAERQRQNDDQREAGRLANAAKAIANVLKNGLEP